MKSLAQAEREARAIVNKWCAGATAVSWVPGSTVVLGGADMVMINKVAKVFGVADGETESFVASTVAMFGGKAAAGLVLDFIPVAGWLVKAAVAGAATKALGEATIKYFKEKSPYR